MPDAARHPSWRLSRLLSINEPASLPGAAGLAGPLPPDAKVGGQVNLYYHLEQFPHALDLLESDAQVSLLFNGSGGGFENGLLTVPENVTSDQISALLKHD
jgi:hypothetical protein